MRLLLVTAAVLGVTALAIADSGPAHTVGELLLRVDPLGYASLVHMAGGGSYCEMHDWWEGLDPNLPVTIDSYEIWSAGSRLDPAGWRSISDAAQEALEAFEAGDSAPLQLIVDTLGSEALQWGELAATPGVLAEGTLTGSLTIQPGVDWSLGRPVTIPPPPSKADLSFYYTKPGIVGTKFPGVVEVWPIPGDANLDDIVDSQDFSILKNSYGTVADWGEGNFNDDDIVDAKDFTILKAYYGEGGSAGATPVPEPVALLLFSLGGLAVIRRKAH